jgi:hypothetical protein
MPVCIEKNEYFSFFVYDQEKYQSVLERQIPINNNAEDHPKSLYDYSRSLGGNSLRGTSSSNVSSG